MNKRHFYYSLPIILLMIVAVAGWFATDYLGNNARQEIIGESHASVLTLSIYAFDTFANIEGAVKSLAGSSWIISALMSKTDQDIEHANSVLDRYNSDLNASVSYLMDADGMTVASSNRKDPGSFVGKSYRFRPYFQEAAKGQPGRYFALGVTSGKRGIYASHPVQNHPGQVLGVVTMKKDIDEMENFFSKYPFCFLVSPDGIIFLSSTPAMVLKSFWPLDKAVREKLIASKQFGNQPFDAVIKKAIADGMEVTLKEKDYFVSRKVIDSDGWSIVLLTPTDHIRDYKLIGILATISVSFLIMFFSGIIFVTDRSKEAIRQSEESKRLLLHAAGDGILGVDAKGQVIFINPTALRMLGFDEEEMLGQSVHDLIHHSHADGSSYPEEDCPMYASFTHAADSHVTDEVLWRKDGGNFPVEYSSMPITKDGKVMGAVVSFKDITDRKRTEEDLKHHRKHLVQMVQERTVELQSTNEQLRQEIAKHKRTLEALLNSEERYRVLFEGSIHGILAVDLETGRFNYANPSICRMLGYSETEFLQLGIEDIHPEDSLDLVNASFELMKRGEKTMASGLLCLRKDGTVFYADIAYAGNFINGRKYIVGFFADVTKRKQAEEKILTLNKELQDSLQELTEVRALEEEAKQAKSEFLANISHELTTPLNHIIGFSQVLLSKNFGDLNEKQQGYVETMLNSGERLYETLKNIVSFVRMDVSNPDMEWEDFLLKDIVDSSLSVFRKAATDRHLTLTLDMEKEACRMIRADRGKLVQVFHNLLSNALKFSKEGGQVTLGVRYRKGSEESGKDNFIEITVEDTGIGIKEEDIPRLFRPFEQIETPLTKLYAGVGIGLALTSKLIEAHGGAIRMESDYGKGSRFIFTVPVKDGHEK